MKNMRLHCTYSVRYKLDGVTHILMPGQALPVYDVSTLGRTGPEFDIVLVVMSTDQNNEFVAAPGLPALKRESYRTALQVLEGNRADTDARLAAQQAQIYALGGASGISVLRPHRLALGVGVFGEEMAWNDPRQQHEDRPLTMAQAEPMLSRLGTKRSELLLPLPRLYAEVDGGKMLAVAVDGELKGGLVETMLPVCPCPLGADIDMLDMLGKTSAHLHRLGATRVWLALDPYEAGSPEEEFTLKSPVTSEQVRMAQAPSPVLYVLPHGSEADYFAPLRFESKAKVNALYRGQDSLDIEVIPQAVKGVRINIIEPVRFEDVLADAALTTG
jgi:hypothetical protein